MPAEGRLTLVGNEDYLRGLPEGWEFFAEELNGLDRFVAREIELDPRAYVGEQSYWTPVGVADAIDIGQQHELAGAVLDEPEAALSMRGNLALMRRMHDLAAEGSQFIVSTHSPILLGYPGAKIYVLSDDGIAETPYEETDVFELTRSFLGDRDQFLHHLFED